MDDGTRNLLALVRHLNTSMGNIYLKLQESISPAGVLDPQQLRFLGDLLGDMKALVHDHADAIDPPVVVPGEVVVPVLPAGAADPPPVAPAGSRSDVHRHIAELRDSARRSNRQGLFDAGNNFAMAADQLVVECGCGNCEAPARA